MYSLSSGRSSCYPSLVSIMNVVNLDGVVIVTGAASGIGLETAYAFAEAGVDGVVFADINDAKAEEAAQGSKQYAKNKGYRAISMHVDVSDEQSIHAMVSETLREFGRIDYCVNSAGVCLLDFELRMYTDSKSKGPTSSVQENLGYRDGRDSFCFSSSQR